MQISITNNCQLSTLFTCAIWFKPNTDVNTDLQSLNQQINGTLACRDFLCDGALKPKKVCCDKSDRSPNWKKVYYNNSQAVCPLLFTLFKLGLIYSIHLTKSFCTCNQTGRLKLTHSTRQIGRHPFIEPSKPTKVASVCFFAMKWFF